MASKPGALYHRLVNDTHLRPMSASREPSPAEGERRIKLWSAETKRWRTYDVDADLVPEILQRLNDLAFVRGVEIVSTCAGHDVGEHPHPIVEQRAFAEVRFAIFFPSSLRLEAQRAHVCIEALACVIAGEDTVLEKHHETQIDQDPRIPRHARVGRSMLIARHARRTSEAPALARMWWDHLVERLTQMVSE
jgi:hypothetical protein